MTETLHILHEPEDAQLANALVDQVEGLIPQCSVTCSSLPGYEAAGGRGEEMSSAVVGLLTRASLAKGTVPFELGLARGHGKPVLAVYGEGLDARSVALPIPAYLTAASGDADGLDAMLQELAEVLGLTAEASSARAERATRDTVVDRPTPAAVRHLVDALAEQEMNPGAAAPTPSTEDRPRPEQYQPKVSEETQPRWSRPPGFGANAAAATSEVAAAVPKAAPPKGAAADAASPPADVEAEARQEAPAPAAGPTPPAVAPVAPMPAAAAPVPPPAMAAPPPAIAANAPPSPAIAARPSAVPLPFGAPTGGPTPDRASQAPVLGQPAWPPTPSVAPRMPLDPLAPPSMAPQRPGQAAPPAFASRAPRPPASIGPAVVPAPSMAPPTPLQPAPQVASVPAAPPPAASPAQDLTATAAPERGASVEAHEPAADAPAADAPGMDRENAYLAGRVFGRASFEPETLGESEAQLDATFGAYMTALGANWPALRALKDVDMWSEAADNMVTSLSAEQAHLGDWYALGLRVSALLEVAGLPTAPGEDEEVDALWTQNLDSFKQLLAHVGVAAGSVAVVEGVLENLRGSQSAQEDAVRIDSALQKSGRELDAA